MEQELNKVIAELSKIDEAAESYAASFDESRSQLMTEFQQKKADYSASLQSESDARLAALSKQMSEENDAKLEKLRKESTENIVAMENSFKQNHTKWAKEIVEDIINEKAKWKE